MRIVDQIFSITATLVFGSSCAAIKTAVPTAPHPIHAAPASEKTRVYVFSHGWHTGIVVPSSIMGDEAPLTTPEGWHLEFGWGDEGFYRAPKVSVPLALNALFRPTPGVMFVSAFKERPEDHFYSSQLWHIDLGAEDRETLKSFLLSGFERDETTGALIDRGPGIKMNSRFYRSRDRYFFPRTCNAWTAEGLRSVGLPLRGQTAPGIMRRLRELEDPGSIAASR